MRSILAIFVVILFLFNGFGTASVSEEERVIHENYTISFSQPLITYENDVAHIEVSEASAVLKQPNKPILPIYKKTFVYPFGTQIEYVEVSISNKINHEFLSYNIINAPEVYPPGFTNQFKKRENPVTYDESVSELYPDSWYDYSLNCGLYNGNPSLILTVNCYPIRTKDDSLWYIDSFDISITYIEPIESERTLLDENLMIIAPEEFNDLLQPFVEHKESKGISTKLITLESIYDSTYFTSQGRDDAEKVKYFIKSAYEEWGIKYVLLVGGRRPGFYESWYMPVRYVHVFWADENRYMSDLYFADIYNADYSFSTWDTDENDVFCQWPSIGNIKDDVDLYPDVLVGRWPCRNTFELKIIIQKTIEYENMQLGKKIVLVGGDNFEAPGIEGEVVCDKSMEYLTDFSAAKVYASEMDVTPKNMREALGNGAMFMHMHGHGSPVKWGTHTPDAFDEWMDGLYITDVPWFFNEEYPILILGGCHTGMFNVSLFNRPWIYGYRPTPEGLGWWFARKIGGGGIATFGYTCFPVASPGEYGDLDGDGINEPDCVESGYGYMQLQLLKGYGVEGNQYLGECWNYAVRTYLDAYKIPYERWHLHTSEGFVLMGDPSLKIGGY